MYIDLWATHSYYICPNIQFILSIILSASECVCIFFMFEIEIVHGATCSSLYSKVSALISFTAVPQCSLQDVPSNILWY